MIRTILVGLLVLAAPFAAGAQSLRVRLIQPAQDSVLTGGSTVSIEWSADGIDERADIEEWEAFLSLDGGRYYGARITPHLDISIHRFRWLVPNVESADARILIRFGNEEEETAIELPLKLRITAGAPRFALSVRTPAVGEAARPGDPGVTVWAVGDRSGGRLMHVASSIASIARSHAVGEENAESSDVPRIDCATFVERAVGAIPARGFAARPRVPASLPDVLLQSSRLNI